MANHLVKPDNRNCKRPRELESPVPDSPQPSSLGKSDSSFSESSGLFYKDEALEKDLNDVSKEINLMLSTYAKLLSFQKVHGKYSSEKSHLWAVSGSAMCCTATDHSGRGSTGHLCSSLGTFS